MSHYIYRCFSCEQEFSATDIEKNFRYLCPSCGTWESKQPLQGVLWLEYDYESISKQMSSRDFLQYEAGKPWLYPQLWPLPFNTKSPGFQLPGIKESFYSKLSLPSNLYSQFDFSGQSLYFLDETRNPTYSYKDRASILVGLKAIQLGVRKIAAASTGNAGSSLAGICARLGLESSIWVPENIPESKRIQIQAYGGEIHRVKGDYDVAFDTCLEISAKMNWYNRNTAYNPLTVEGKKSGAYDLYILSKGKMPEAIFVPVGDGVVISGIYKGLWELKKLGWIEKLPRLIAVQAEGSNALVRYISEHKFTYSPAQTLADSICAGAPRNLYMAARAVTDSRGVAVSVSDEEIINAQRLIARQVGMLVEPAAAASLAGFMQMRDDVTGNNLILFTGLGLKDVAALQQWNKPLQARSPEEWKSLYKST
jgi:threonine synthase